MSTQPQAFPPPLHPWDQALARSSLERWDELCARSGWGGVPAARNVLEALFGASWYFTRFLFYHGRQGARQLERAPPGPSLEETAVGDPETGLERLRVRRNENMLRWLAAELRGELSRETLEQGLTELAAATLRTLVRGAIQETRQHFMVMGMGRLAGAEMNYGSDLDLIFLYPNAAGSSTINREVLLLLRRCAALSPSGQLYEIDTRLRPHGSAGTLVTSLDGFGKYYQGARDTWEKQLLCRCRPLYDPEGRAAGLLEEIRSRLLGKTHPGAARLREDILAMRQRVEQKLGHPLGRHDVKCGPGGLMDIDFITHYLQLTHGAGLPELYQGGTRHCLRIAARNELLERERAAWLLHAYDQLKRIEASLRLLDMRAVSSFPQDPEKLARPARATGHPDGISFLRAYRKLTTEVRRQYNHLLGRKVDTNSAMLQASP